MDVSDAPDREFKTVVIKRLAEVRRAKHKEREKFI